MARADAEMWGGGGGRADCRNNGRAAHSHTLIVHPTCHHQYAADGRSGPRATGCISTINVEAWAARARVRANPGHGFSCSHFQRIRALTIVVRASTLDGDNPHFNGVCV